MILKVKTSCNPEEWMFFDEVKQLSKQTHHNIDSEILSPERIANKIVVRADVYDFTANPENEGKKEFLELWAYGKTTEETRQILCFSPAYLINNEGKTIEKF